MGAVVTKALLPSQAEHIVAKNGALFVRAYDHDLVVELRR